MKSYLALPTVFMSLLVGLQGVTLNRGDETNKPGPYANQVDDVILSSASGDDQTTVLDEKTDPSYYGARKKRALTAEPGKLWPKGIVPYVYHETTKSQEEHIQRAMKMWERFTCIRFVPWTKSNGTTTNENLKLGHDAYISLGGKYEGCWAETTGRKRANQTVSCCDFHPCVHELGHVLGLIHEQQTDDPVKDWWIRVNFEYVIPESLIWFKKIPTHKVIGLVGYDMSSTMHYSPWQLMNPATHGLTITQLYPDLPATYGNYYYAMMEISLAYKCKELYCSDMTLTCENDGYPTLVDGVCTCRCVQGLDPATGCRSIYKQDGPEVNFPTGSYALPEPESGCPDNSWKRGSSTQVNKAHQTSEQFHVKGHVETKKLEQGYCVSQGEGPAKWPYGNYCIYRKGGTCPEVFEPGFVQYDNQHKKKDDLIQSGELPDGKFDSNTRLEFCCSKVGQSKYELFLPSRKPLMLIKQPDLACSNIRGMHYTEEWLTIENYGDENVQEIGGAAPVREVDEKKHTYKTEFCHYKPAMIDCGHVIDLRYDDRTVTFGSPTGTELECYWLIRVPKDEKILLDFDQFDVKCPDVFEVRYARIGQPGHNYCDKAMDRSFISINNTILIRLSTYEGRSAQFNATVKLIANAEMCYDVSDHGVSYVGKVNFTMDLKPCLPWIEVASCEHNMLSVKDITTVLEGNYCRNPDYNTGIQPWCYTDVNHCERQYCDVCRHGKRFDTIPGCDKLKRKGFCKDNSVPEVISQCAKTCENETPDPEVLSKLNKIRCSTPPEAPDGSIVGEVKASYSVGDKVTYRCNSRDDMTRIRKCLTSGQWSDMGFVCKACPDNDGLHDGNCYRYYDDGKNFRDAVTTCEQNGGMLAPVNAADVEFIRSEIKTNFKLWMGVDEVKEGTWVALDGQEATWINWRENEPNNHFGKEECACFWPSGQASDLLCNRKLSFVCKTPAVALPLCLDYWDKCGDLFSHDPTICEKHSNFAHNYCPYTCGVCAVNRSRVACAALAAPIPKNAYTNETFQHVVMGETVVYACKEGFVPAGGNEVRGCQQSGKLTGQPLICSKGCPEGWTYYKETRHCYQGFKKKSYQEAQAHCARYQGTLATAKTIGELAFVSSFRDYTMWLGLDDLDGDGVWRWSDGEELGWAHWAGFSKGGNPNKSHVGKECVALTHFGALYNRPCHYRDDFTCKVDLKHITDTPELPLFS